VLLQRLGDRRPSDLLIELLQLTPDVAVNPAGVVGGQPGDELTDQLHDPGVTDASLGGVGPFRRDQLAMPAQDRVGSDDGRGPGQQPVAEGGALGREPAALILGEPEPALAELLLQEAVATTSPWDQWTRRPRCTRFSSIRYAMVSACWR
jgi:hypothetical protein